MGLIKAAVNAVGSIIKQRTESYILDKADAMGIEIIVQVSLDQENQRYPQCVCIQGTVSPFAKLTVCNPVDKSSCRRYSLFSLASFSMIIFPKGR